MKTITYGLIGGLISTSGFILSGIFGPESFVSSSSELIGYVAMVVAMSFVFFGIRQYKHENGGKIKFKAAFMKGLSIVAIASCVYVIGWEIYFPNFMPDFATEYQAMTIEKMESEGASIEEVEESKRQMSDWIENYKNPFIRVPLTFMEIFPIGLIIALFSSLILRTKDNE